MKIGVLRHPNYAYATYVGGSASIHHEIVRVWGTVFNCYERQMPIGQPVYLWITIEEGTVEAALAYAKSMNPFDLRTLDMIKAGCCPPRLMSELLKEDATAGEPLD